MLNSRLLLLVVLDRYLAALYEPGSDRPHNTEELSEFAKRIYSAQNRQLPPTASGHPQAVPFVKIIAAQITLQWERGDAIPGGKHKPSHHPH